MATNYKNSVYAYFSNIKDTYPRSSTLTGTFSIASGQKSAVGVGTLCLSELNIGDWIYSAAQNELRRVTGVNSNLSFSIDYAFTSVISGASLVVVKRDNCDMIKEISVSIPVGSSAGQIDGATLPSGIGVSFSKASRGADDSSKSDIVDPIIIDATGTVAVVIAIKG